MSQAEAPLSITRRDWEDIDYLCVVEAHSNYADLKVYKVVGRGDDGPIFLKRGWNSSADIVDDLALAQVYLSGSIKWDGCSNLRFDEQDDTMLHFCGKQAAVDTGTLLGRLYDMAAEIIPTWCGD